MLDLHKIDLLNFRSYRGNHSFVFPTESGLYFFTGNNLAEPALSSNGAGKSTLLDAITWILYGKTTRGLKASEVISWGADTCEGTLDLTIGTRFAVRRTQKPNGLYIDDAQVDQEALQKHLRLSFEAFLCSVLIPQFRQSFFDLAPAAKLAQFSDIMNLEYWVGLSEQAATDAADTKLKIEHTKTIITRMDAEWAALTQTCETFAKLSADFERKRTYDLFQLGCRIQELEQTSSLLNLPSISEALRVKLHKAESGRDVWLKFLTNASKDRSLYIGQRTEVLAQINAVEELKGTCPTCAQLIDPNARASSLKQLRHRESILTCKIDIAEEDADLFKQHLVKSKLLVDRLVSDLEECLEDENAVKISKNEIKLLKQQVAELKGSLNSYAPLHDKHCQDLKNHEERRSLQALTLRDLETKLAAKEFWIKGFRQIRLFIIERALATLEVEVNNCLAQLGMPDWQVSFDVERENKSGGITKGFVVMIQSPANTGPVRWENWSGGETQRLQLAGTLGLANLIMTQNGLNNMIELYDEPSTHLSPEGMFDLANLLSDRATSEGKRIWIIDHTSIANFGDFRGIITARKTHNGSELNYKEGN